MPSKSKPIAEQQVYDTSTASTGAFDIPVGTTAQRPGSPTSGNLRFNTTLDSAEIYDGNNWGKVSTVTPVLSSVTGNIYNSAAGNLTLAGANFGFNLVVSFTPSGGSAVTATVTPTSDAAATVAVPSAIYGQNSGTVIGITVTNSDNRTSAAVNKTVLDLPTGGTIVTSGGFRYHTFTSSTNFVVPTNVTLNAEYIIIAGGGGGAGYGGGGGAGGYITNNGGAAVSVSSGTYPVVIGGGGAGVSNAAGVSGTNSSWNSLTTIGGGYGEIAATAGAAGGSGGGGGYAGGAGGAGTSGQGNAGGAGYQIGGSNVYLGGGGGGKGGVGATAATTTAGAGGLGFQNTVWATATTTGDNAYYASGGGGGCAGYGVYGTQYPGLASDGGGGNGSQAGNGGSARNGLANTGGGGGGVGYHGTSGAQTGGPGGSGLVIIRYSL